MDTKTYTHSQFEEMTEAQIEGIIMRKEGNINDARYILGKLMIEGTSDKVPKNENKGLNWLKEACKQNHMGAMEYKTYWEIRFDKAPQLIRIRENLEKIIEANKSCRACNTLAELNHASAGSELAKLNAEVADTAAKNREIAAKYYLMSAEQGDVIGLHWTGVFYHEGFGFAKNVEKAIEYLTKAAELGNGQSLYQLFMIYSGKDGQEAWLKNPTKAYGYLIDSMLRGVTYFDEIVAYFKANYDELAPLFVKQKSLPIEINESTKKDIMNMHEAMISELKIAFSAALGKERLYHRPCGFLNDQ